MVFRNDEAEPFQAFEVFGDRIEFFLGGAAFELGGDLFGGPVAGGGAQQIASRMAASWALGWGATFAARRVRRRVLRGR